MVEAISWVGLAVCLASAALVWLALQSRAARAGDAAHEPWIAAWSASEGNGSPGGAPPRAPELTIAQLWAFRLEIIRWVRRRGVPASEAEDLAQTILEGAWRSRRKWDRENCALHCWLYVIMRNHVNTYHHRAHVRYETLVADPRAGRRAPDDPEAAVEQKELCKRALAILDRLPQHLAEVWLHYEIQETPAHVIAEELGRPLSTVWDQLAQVRGMIAREVARENAREARAMTRRRGRPE